jgi:hypothetical protein
MQPLTLTPRDVIQRAEGPPVLPLKGAAPAPFTPPALPPHLTKLDRQILLAVTDQPRGVGELARLVDPHRDVDSYFRCRVRHLTRAGLLLAQGQNEERTYRRADPAGPGAPAVAPAVAPAPLPAPRPPELLGELLHALAGLLSRCAVTVTLSSRADESGGPAAGQDGPAARAAAGKLTALDRRILAAAPREEVTMTRLAHLAGGHDPDSYFRERVRRLVGLGRLVTEFGGYRLAEGKPEGGAP